MRALIIGFHGRRNLGDDVFLILTTKYLEHALVLDKIYVTADSEALPVVSTSIPMLGIYPSSQLSSIGIFVLRFISGLRSDLIVFSAGSLFKSYNFRVLFLYLKLLKILRPKIRIIAIGVSIGPFASSGDQYWAGRALSLLDSILVRDLRSYALGSELISSANIHQGCDLGLLLQAPKNIYPKNNNVVGLALASLGGYGKQDYEDRIVNFISEALQILSTKNFDKVKLFTICDDPEYGDKVINERLIEVLPKSMNLFTIPYQYDSMSSINELQTCDLILCSRMHAGVFAMMDAIPVVQIAYEPKIYDFYTALNLDTQGLMDMEELQVGTAKQLFGRLEDLQAMAKVNSRKIAEKRNVMEGLLLEAISNIKAI